MATDILLKLNQEICCNCGIPFGIESTHQSRLMESHVLFYCPNGHGQHYTGKTEVQKLREELAAKDATIERVRSDVNYYSEKYYSKEKELVNKRRVLTRTKNYLKASKLRAHNGICPCCNRQFKDVLKHLEQKHPTRKKEFEEKFQALDN